MLAEAVIPEPLSYAQLISHYESLGYSRDLIVSWEWASQERELRAVCDRIVKLAPKRILEVGGWAGFATNMIAAAAPADAKIISVDPNFAIAAEVKTKPSFPKKGHDVPAQEVARQVAVRLGHADKITFAAGGFSSADTYLTRSGGASRAPVIGPEICKKYGPFDFVFIDGLHYADVVASDLQLAAAHLSPSGVIAITSALGTRWGRQVRSGVMQLLDKRAGLVFSQSKEWDPDGDIAFLAPAGKEAQPAAAVYDRPSIVRAAQLMRAIFDARSALIVGSGDDRWGNALSEAGVENTESAQPGSPVSKKYDICLCLNAANIPSDLEEAAVASCTRASDVVILAAPTPGHGLRSYQNERPAAHWAERFFAHGYLFSDELRPLLEESEPGDPELNLFTARRMFDPEKGPSRELMLEILKQKEARIEGALLHQQFQGRDARTLARRIEALQTPPPEPDRSSEEKEKMRAGRVCGNLVELKLEPALFVLDGGNAYRYTPRTLAAAIFAWTPYWRTLTVYEDGKELAERTDDHDAIRQVGRGRYSMWSGAIYISASDNSNPATNGKTYTVMVPSHVRFLENMPPETLKKLNF